MRVCVGGGALIYSSWERFLFLSQGGIRDFYISQHFPEETEGEGKLLLGAQLAVAGDQPPWPWLGASMEKHL